MQCVETRFWHLKKKFRQKNHSDEKAPFRNSSVSEVADKVKKLLAYFNFKWQIQLDYVTRYVL
jgi:hypothetical protein